MFLIQIKDISKGNKLFNLYNLIYIRDFSFYRIWHIRQIWQENQANLPAQLEFQKHSIYSDKTGIFLAIKITLTLQPLWTKIFILQCILFVLCQLHKMPSTLLLQSHQTQTILSTSSISQFFFVSEMLTKLPPQLNL